jgi:hypothetical protein
MNKTRQNEQYVPGDRCDKVATCNFCSKVLGKQYYFTCHICGATYCYIHMSKHARSHRPPMPLVRST